MNYTAKGGVSVSGAAVARLPALVISGTAVVSSSFRHVPTGRVKLAGSASLVNGGFKTGGSAAVTVSYRFTPTQKLTTTGTPTLKASYVYMAAGGRAVVGGAVYDPFQSTGRVCVPAGGSTFSGAAEVTAVMNCPLPYVYFGGTRCARTEMWPHRRLAVRQKDRHVVASALVPALTLGRLVAAGRYEELPNRRATTRALNDAR